MKKTPKSGVEADKKDRTIFLLSLAINFLWSFWLLKAQDNLFSSNLIKTPIHTGKSSNNQKKKKKKAKLICFQSKKSIQAFLNQCNPIFEAVLPWESSSQCLGQLWGCSVLSSVPGACSRRCLVNAPTWTQLQAASKPCCRAGCD